MASNIQFKRATAATLYAVNPVLLRGEPGLEIDTNKIKYGDGVTPWRELPYGNPALEVVDGGEFIAPAVTATPGTFSPPFLTGLTLWLDGTDPDYVHMVNNRLSVWEDMSETRTRFVQSNKANRPTTSNQIEAQAVVTFDGVNDTLIGDLELPAEFTMLVAFRRRGASTNGKLITALTAANANELVLCGTETGSEFGVKIGSAYYATQPVDDLVPVVYTLQCTATGFSTRLNGLNTQAETQTITGTRTHFALGGSRVDFAADNFGGDIAEVIIYDSVLAAADLLDAENYLMSRWGIVQVQHPLLTGMQAFWPLNEESGNRVDITDAALELTPTGVVDFEAGVIGNAAKFTGSANYLTAPEALTLNSTFSLSLWFKTATITGTGGDPPRIIQNWAGGTQGQMTLGFGDDSGDNGVVWAYIRTTDSNYRVVSAALEANRWYHVVLVFDPAANKLQLYIDGALAAQTATAGALATSSIPLRVGIGEQTAMQNTTPFLLDQLGIWDRVLDAADVEMLYNHELGKEDFTADLYGDNVSLLLHMDKPANAAGTTGGGGGSSTLWNGLEAFWKLDDLEDMTGNGYTLTNINNTAFTPAKIGNGAESDNYSSNFLALENFRIMRAAGFSVAGWIRHISGPAGGLISQGTQFGFTFGPALYLGVDGAWFGNDVWANGPDRVDLFSVPGYTPDGQWYHMAITYDGTTAKAYKNGVLVGSGTIAVDDNWVISSRMRILGPMEEYWSDAQADAVGYWTRALTEAEIAELYNNGDGTETFAAATGDPDFASVSLLLPMDSDFSDASQNNLTVTPAGYVAVSATQSKFGGASAKFNGYGDRLDIAENELFNLAGGDYTVECFFNATDLSGADAARLWTFETNYESWGLLLANDGNGWIGMNRYGIPIGIGLTNNLITTGTWYHVALVRYNGVATLYLNGTAIGSDSEYAWVPAGPCQLSLGGNLLNFGYTNYNGYIDDFRVTKGVARYTADFTPPTAAFPTQSGSGGGGGPITPIPGIDPAPALLLHFDGANGSTTFTDSSLNNLALTAATPGGAQISTTASKFGGASLSLNTDYLSSAAYDFQDLGDDWTIEAFVWRPTGTGDATVINLSNMAGAPHGHHVWINSLGQLRWDEGTQESATGGNVMPDQWVHVAAVRSAGAVTIYVDGVVAATSSVTPLQGPYKVWIGAYDSSFGPAYTSGMYIDELRITKGLALYTGNFTPPTAPFPDPQPNPSLLVHFDNGIADSSLNQHEITNNFNVVAEAPSTIPAPGFENAGVFDGLGAYLSIPDDPAFDLSSGPFCIELRFAAFDLPLDLSSNGQGLIAKDQYGVSFSWGIFVSQTEIRLATANIAGDWDFLVNQAVTENTWHHIAVTGDGSTMKMFFNGNLVGTKYRTLTNAAADITIGCTSYNNPGAFFSGFIDEVRVVKGAQVYTDNFTPPTAPFENPRAILPLNDPNSNNVSLLLNMNGSDGSTTFTDSSNNGLTVTANGATISTTESKFGGASGYFDGDAYLSVPSNSVFNFGEGDFTIEGWFNFTAIGSFVRLFSRGNWDSPSMTSAVALEINGLSSGVLWVGDTMASISNLGLSYDTWHHMALTRLAGLVRVFVDGQQKISVVKNVNIENSDDFYIGTLGGGGLEGTANVTFNGYIDDLRITKGVARYTTNFYPPQQEFSITQGGGGGGVTANASLLLHFDGSDNSTTFTDDSANALTPTVNGVVISTAQNKFGGASGAFNGGSASALDYADSPLFGFGTGDFTIEMFTYMQTGGARHSVISVGTYQTGILWRLNANNTDNLYFNANVTQTFWNWQQGGTGGGGGTVPLDAWAHIALTRQNNVVRIFVDGVKAFEEDIGEVDLGTTQPLTIGTGAHERSPTDAYYGYIDDLRIIKGVAVYTADFTPPTAPLSASIGGGGGGGGGAGPIAVFIDTSKHNHDVTPAGNAYLNLEDIKYGNASGEFAGGHCTIPMSPEFAFGVGDFTVEFWGKLNYAAQSAVFSTSSSAEDAGTYLIGFRNDANMFGFCYDMPNFTFVSADISAHYDTWAHYAFVRLDGVLKMYVNGIEVATANTVIDLDGGEQTTTVIGRRWTDVDDYYLDGLIDDFRITKGVARYISSFNPPTKAFPDPVLVSPPAPTGDPYAEYVTLLLHMDGANGSTSFSDNSYLQNTLTAEGNAAISTTQSKFGGASGYFDGADSSVTADLQLDGGGDFTCECWFWVNSPYGERPIFAQGESDTTGAFIVHLSSDGAPALYASNFGRIMGVAGSVGVQQWYHIALCRAGTTLSLFLDGVLVGTTTDTLEFTQTPFKIGDGYGGIRYLSGHIDDLRITKGVARYTANFTPPTAALPNPFEPANPAGDTTLLLHADGADGSTTFTDSSTAPKTPALNGTPTISTAQSKFGGASLKTNSGSLLYQNSGAFNFAGDFTIEGWFYFNENNVGYQPLISAYAYGDATGFALVLETNNTLNFYGSTGSYYWGLACSSSYQPPVNTWVHIAVCRASGNVSLFADGVLVGSAANNLAISGGTTVAVGGYPYFPDFPRTFNGFIDEVRIVNGVGHYPAAFTPPTAPFGSAAVTPSDITGCDLWLDSTADISTVNGSIATWSDKSGNGRTATPADYAPAPTVAAGEGPNGQDVVRFSGDPNVLDVSYQFNLKNSSGFVLLKSAQTVDFGWRRILGFQPTTGSDSATDDGMSVILNNDQPPLGFALWNNGLQIQVEQTIPFDWTLIAYTIDENGNISFRVNGVEVDTATAANMAAKAGSNLYIGHGGTFYLGEALQGDIAEIALFDHKLGPAALVGLEQGILTRWLPPPAPPEGGETLLLAHFDSSIPSSSGETFVDSSGNNVGMTSNDGAIIATDESKFGGASLLLGVMGSGSVVINPSADLDISSGDFTVEFWTRPNSQSVPYPSILGTNQWLVQNAFSIRYAHDYVADRFSVHSYPMNDVYLSSNTTFPPNAWYHVAVTRQGLVDRLFVNGMLVDSYTHSSTPNWPNLTADGPAYLGNSWDGSLGQYSGFVDDLRITKGAALYTANFPVPNLPVGADMTLLLHMDGAQFADSSSKQHAILQYGYPTIASGTSKFGSGSLAMSGSDYIYVESPTDFNFGTGDFTVEFWFYPPTGANFGANTLITTAYPADASGFWIGIQGGNSIHWLFGNGGDNVWEWAHGPYTGEIAANVFNFDQWNHLAMTRSGGTARLFVNGVLIDSLADATNLLNVNNRILIGGRSNFGQYFNGYIDEVRVIKGVAMYDAAFAAPTAPFPDPPTFPPVVLMHFDGANNGSPLVDSSPTGLSFSPSTLATFDSMIKQFGDAAFSYNGANDVYSTTRGVPDLTDGDFTVECWVYRQNYVSVYSNVLFLHASDNNLSYQGGLNLYINQNGTVDCNNGFSAAMSGGTVPVGQWTHIAVVRIGETSTLYVNGTSVSTSTQSPVTGPYILCLGFVPSNSGFESDLIVDELRIIKTAVYTGNFTPPTAPFTA